MATLSPICRGWRGREWALSLSSILACLLACARSLRSASSLHSCLGWNFPFCAGRKPFISLPNITIAGLRPVRGSTVFLCSSRARANASVSKVPLGPMFPLMRRLADFTATSAHLLALG